MNDNLFEDIEAFINGKSGDKKPQLFTDEEYQHFIISMARSRGDKGFHEEEVEELFRWLDLMRISNTLIDLVLKDVALIDWNGDEPTFSISPLGRKVMESDGA